MHAAQREVRPVRRRAQLLAGDARQGEGRGGDVDQVDPPSAARRIIAKQLGTDQVDPLDGQDSRISPAGPGAGLASLGAARRGGRGRTGAPSALLGALACSVLVLIAGMVVFVFAKAWPSFAHNGLVLVRLGRQRRPAARRHLQLAANPDQFEYKLQRLAAAVGDVAHDDRRGRCSASRWRCSRRSSSSSSRPRALRRVLDPVVRLLAAVPSVIYGLIGMLVIVPFVGNHLIASGRKESVAYVVQLDGQQPARGRSLILTVMITPIMIAIIVDALRSVPRVVDRGRRRARREPLARDVDDLGARGAAGDRRRGGARHRARARRGDHALDGVGLGRASRRTRSTASRSSSSRRARWRRRSSTTPTACR